jgi:hypothetical protein
MGIRAPEAMVGIPIDGRVEPVEPVEPVVLWGCSGGVVDMPALLSSGR